MITIQTTTEQMIAVLEYFCDRPLKVQMVDTGLFHILITDDQWASMPEGMAEYVAG